MVTFRAINASWPRRVQFAAFAGLASVSILAAGPKGLRAEWFAFKKIPIPVESLEPQPNDGFDKAIRNILKEAKRLEKKGQFDQAIILAERAAKISEESSSLVKMAPDISSSAIAGYATELRLKKQQVELSQKRVKTPALNTTAIASSRLSKESPPAKDKPTRSSYAKSPVPAESVASQVRGKENSETDLESPFRDQPSQSRPRPRANNTNSIAASTANRDVIESESFDLPSPSERPFERETTTKDDDNVSTIVASTEEPPFEPFIEEEPRQTRVQHDIRSFRKSVARSRDAIQAEKVHATPDPEKLTLISSSSVDAEHPTTPSDTQAVKLRYRYQDTEARPIVSIKSTSDFRTLETETEVTTAAIETDGSSSEHDGQSLADRPETEFPVIQVRDLRQAAGDSYALDPGKPLPTSKITKEESPEDDEEQRSVPIKALSPFRIRRSLKLRNTYSVLPLLTPIAARPTREPVVGRTSIIHWRPAKDASSVATDDAIPEDNFKTNVSAVEIRHMQSDTDRSIINHGSTGIRHGSTRDSKIQAALEVITESSISNRSKRTDENSSLARREFRGSLWDNAAAPTFEGTWRPAKPQSENQGSAPLPPKTNRIEQTSFFQPQHTVKKDLRSELNRNSIKVSEQASNSSLESSSETADFAETSEAEQPVDSQSWMDEVESADAIVTSDSIQQSAGEAGLPESTVSTMLGAFGVGLLIAGIWVFRATAGIKHA